MGSAHESFTITFQKKKECEYFFYFFDKLKKNELPNYKTPLNIFPSELIWKLEVLIGYNWYHPEESPIIEELYRISPNKLFIYMWAGDSNPLIEILKATCISINVVELGHYIMHTGADGVSVNWIHEGKSILYSSLKTPEFVYAHYDNGWNDKAILEDILFKMKNKELEVKSIPIKALKEIGYLNNITLEFYKEFKRDMEEHQLEKQNKKQ